MNRRNYQVLQGFFRGRVLGTAKGVLFEESLALHLVAFYLVSCVLRERYRLITCLNPIETSALACKLRA